MSRDGTIQLSDNQAPADADSTKGRISWDDINKKLQTTDDAGNTEDLGGLTEVATDSTLTGDGTVGDPLSVASIVGGVMTKPVYDAADISEQVVGLTATQTLTNKTLTAPVVNSPTGIVKGDVGLGNVDNTSDADKPVSTAQQTEIDTKEDSFSKNTAFNKNFGTGADDTCEGDDSRLSDSRTPTAHAASHTDGSDDIQSATAAQKGLATAVQITKLDGIEAGADKYMGSLISGWITGMVLTINADPTKVDISAGTGVIYDWTTPTAPVQYEITYAGATGIVVDDLLTAPFTVFSIDNTGTLQQQSTEITNQQRRTSITLDTATHADLTTVTGIAFTSVLSYEPSNAIIDYINALGAINSGNTIRAASTDLSIRKNVGTTTLPWLNGRVDAQNPTVNSNPAIDPLTNFTYIYQDGVGGFTFVLLQNDIDSDNWDDGTGTLDSTQANRYYIQRIYYFAQSDGILVTYGQDEYNSQAEAEASVFLEDPALSPFTDSGVFVTALILKGQTVDLSLTVNTFADIFDQSSSSGVSTDIDAIHDNVAAEIVAITEKTTVIADDVALIEDSADADNKKSVKMSTIKAYVDDINTVPYAANQTLTTAECKGYVVYVTAAATMTLPAIADGMSVTIVTIGAVAVSVDPNASDLILLDGVALDDGDKITNTSTAGDIAVLTYYSTDGWHASTNGWTDGGA